MSDFESPDGQKISKYNSALAQLFRIDKIWQDAHNHSRNIEYSKWNEDLDRVWCELESDVTKDEDFKTIEKINNILLGLAIYNLNPKLRKKNPELYSKIVNLQKKYLIQKETFLRRLQNSQGKGAAYQESAEEYMDDDF